MKIFRYLTLITVIFSFLLLFRGNVQAFEIISREEMGIEESLSEPSDIYSSPQRILITQLEGYNRNLNSTPEEWIKFLYYYSVTRLNLNDIPYNFLIDQSGNIYEGARGGLGVNPGLEGGQNTILIGIMDSSPTLSPSVSSSLKSFIEEISYLYGIKGDSWDFVDLKIKQEEGSFSYLVPSKSSKPLRSSLEAVIKDIKWSDTEHLEYKASVVSVEYEKEVTISQRLKVKVLIKNENNHPWFSTPNYIYVSTKDAVESPHAINSVWESFSKPTYVQDDVVKPGDTTEINFELLAKSKPDKYTESFFLMKSSDIVFADSSFDVEFNIVKGDNKVIQIVSPQYGFVNIRECRWYSCKKVEVANDGEVFVTTKKEEGFYEIVYGENQKGWISQAYVREI